MTDCKSLETADSCCYTLEKPITFRQDTWLKVAFTPACLNRVEVNPVTGSIASAHQFPALVIGREASRLWPSPVAPPPVAPPPYCRNASMIKSSGPRWFNHQPMLHYVGYRRDLLLYPPDCRTWDRTEFSARDFCLQFLVFLKFACLNVNWTTNEAKYPTGNSSQFISESWLDFVWT